jgi:hypothetical protein
MNEQEMVSDVMLICYQLDEYRERYAALLDTYSLSDIARDVVAYAIRYGDKVVYELFREIPFNYEWTTSTLLDIRSSVAETRFLTPRQYSAMTAIFVELRDRTNMLRSREIDADTLVGG